MEKNMQNSMKTGYVCVYIYGLQGISLKETTVN